MMYTVEIYRTDKRTKSGERLVLKRDYDIDDYNALEDLIKCGLFRNERYEIHETMVTRINSMTGGEFQERYDTPYHCSPRSEIYWMT